MTPLWQASACRLSTMVAPMCWLALWAERPNSPDRQRHVVKGPRNASIAVDVMMVPGARLFDYASSYRSREQDEQKYPEDHRMLAANNAAACSSRNTSAVGSNRKTAHTNGGASSDDALPNADGATIDAPGIGGHSNHHSSKQARPAIARSRGYLPGQMCLSSRR